MADPDNDANQTNGTAPLTRWRSFSVFEATLVRQRMKIGSDSLFNLTMKGRDLCITIEGTMAGVPQGIV
ncbi:hypothetical protein B0A91_14185 [Pseudomonas syringae]|nr:hypothetical protein B1F67_06245 [Pseudomonas syringae]RXU08777.1 hypothetical protein B1F68_06755 [Pseudomonas syringae]RXU10851.1 hypothetical protein BXU05_19805 [Pseudomonas syringae]RXU14554.1 hypothetical protein B1F70_12500 [Pseudomonas syringae]RXU21942.1 hypothetical protein B0A91_14185 [Pseudomonas syringae]